MIASEEAVLRDGALADLALEAWRLSKSVTGGNDEPLVNGVAIRYSVKKMKQVLEASGCSYVDLTGRPYDAGMALDILSVEDSPKAGTGEHFVKEMVSPIILWKGRVLRHGEAILAKVSMESDPSGPREEK